VFLSKNPDCIEDKRYGDEQKFDIVEPDKNTHNRSKPQELWNSEETPEPDSPENIQGQKCNERFGVKMKSIKKDGRGETVEGPHFQGEPVAVPVLPKKKKDLQTEQGADQTHKKTDDDFGASPFEEEGQGIDGHGDHGQPRLVEGIFTTLRFVGSQLCFPGHITEVIPVPVIVVDLEISVLQKAVGYDEVVGFVTAEVYILENEGGAAGAIEECSESEKKK
jgi:hypothetical protein